MPPKRKIDPQSNIISPFPVIAPCLKTRTGASGLRLPSFLISRRKRRAAVLRTAVPGLLPRKWKMTKNGRSQNQRNTRNINRNPNTRRVAWDDLRAMTPIEPHTDFSKPPIGYMLDDDGNYPESIREVF